MSELRRDARGSPRCRHSQGRRGGRARQGWPSATASGGYGLDQPAPLGGFVCRYIKGEVWAPTRPDPQPPKPRSPQNIQNGRQKMPKNPFDKRNPIRARA